MTVPLLLFEAAATVGAAVLFDDLHGEELIRVDLVQPDPDTHRERRPQVQRAAKQLAGVG
jgi:hypothetical protein